MDDETVTSTLSIGERLAALQQAASKLPSSSSLESSTEKLQALKRELHPELELEETLDLSSNDPDEAQDLLDLNDSSNDEFSWILKFQNIPVLSPQEQIECAKDIEAGIFAQAVLNGDFSYSHVCKESELREIASLGVAQKERMIRGNVKLVLHWARIMSERDRSMVEENFGDGVFGLFRAVETWDHQRGYQFSTYASFWVRQTISRGKALRRYMFHVPIHIQEIWRQEPQENWTQLAAYARAAIDTAVSWEDLIEDVDALDPQEFSEDNIELFITSVEIIESFEYLMILLNLCVNDPKKTRKILSERFGVGIDQPSTLDEIGKGMGVTRERIRQLETAGIEGIRLLLLQNNSRVRSAVLAWIRSNRRNRYEQALTIADSRAVNVRAIKAVLRIPIAEAKEVMQSITDGMSYCQGDWSALLND